MRMAIQLGPEMPKVRDLHQTPRSMFGIRLRTVPRKGDVVECSTPSGCWPKRIRGRVAEVGHFTRNGLLGWVRGPEVSLVLSPDIA